MVEVPILSVLGEQNPKIALALPSSSYLKRYKQFFCFLGGDKMP